MVSFPLRKSADAPSFKAKLKAVSENQTEFRMHAGLFK